MLLLKVAPVWRGTVRKKISFVLAVLVLIFGVGSGFAWWAASREYAEVKWVFAIPIVEVHMPLNGLRFAAYYEDSDGARPRLFVHQTVYLFTPRWYFSYQNNKFEGEYCSSSFWPFSNPQNNCRSLTNREKVELFTLFHKGRLLAAGVRKSPHFPYR